MTVAVSVRADGQQCVVPAAAGVRLPAAVHGLLPGILDHGTALPHALLARRAVVPGPAPVLAAADAADLAGRTLLVLDTPADRLLLGRGAAPGEQQEQSRHGTLPGLGAGT